MKSSPEHFTSLLVFCGWSWKELGAIHVIWRVLHELPVAVSMKPALVITRWLHSVFFFLYYLYPFIYLFFWLHSVNIQEEFLYCRYLWEILVFKTVTSFFARLNSNYKVHQSYLYSGSTCFVWKLISLCSFGGARRPTCPRGWTLHARVHWHQTAVLLKACFDSRLQFHQSQTLSHWLLKRFCYEMEQNRKLLQLRRIPQAFQRTSIEVLDWTLDWSFTFFFERKGKPTKYRKKSLFMAWLTYQLFLAMWVR